MEDKKQIKSVEMFNKTAERYYDTYNGRHAKKVTALVYQSLEEIMQESGALLDVGCGTGSLIRQLENRYKRWKFFGIDLSEKMLGICERYKSDRQCFFKASSEKIPFDEKTFKVVTCTDSFHHYVNPQKAMEEMYRVLEKDGHLVMSEIWLPFIARKVTNLFLKVFNTGDVKIYGKSELTKLMREAGFRTVHFKVKSLMIYECIATK